jgi:hypothetical protein
VQNTEKIEDKISKMIGVSENQIQKINLKMSKYSSYCSEDVLLGEEL